MKRQASWCGSGAMQQRVPRRCANVHGPLDRAAVRSKQPPEPRGASKEGLWPRPCWPGVAEPPWLLGPEEVTPAEPPRHREQRTRVQTSVLRWRAAMPRCWREHPWRQLRFHLCRRQRNRRWRLQPLRPERMCRPRWSQVRLEPDRTRECRAPAIARRIGDASASDGKARP